MAAPPEVARNVEELLQAHIGPVQKWLEIKKVLVDNNLAHYTKAKATEFVVHAQNRASTLINPFSMHVKGLEILRAGADKSWLDGAVCIELPAAIDKRKKEVAPCENLVAASPYLASLTGKDRFASLSCGQTTQFVKAII